ncbi:MAG: hypothetical protein LBD23_07905 [Oscillospiraceae bacterium]|jgi:hypothetical protein|nr:hypothetical protein [Oscillospiraceae bacterium]
MQKKFVICIIIFLLINSLTADAVDLPIDINVIGQDSGSGEAHTANVNVDILTPTAKEITQAIIERNRQNREAMRSDLFTVIDNDVTLSEYEQILISATTITIFNNPSNYNRTHIPTDDNLFSMWIVVSLFATSVFGGFFLAYILMQRKKEKEYNVH